MIPRNRGSPKNVCWHFKCNLSDCNQKPAEMTHLKEKEKTDSIKAKAYQDYVYNNKLALLQIPFQRYPKIIVILDF